MSMCSTLTMCSYGNLFNTNSISTVNSILPGELAEVLHTADKSRKIDNNICPINRYPYSSTDTCWMLLDCRSFIAYNFNHIAGALNVNCTGIGKKRLQQGKASLVDLISSEYGKELLKSGRWVKAVVYDDSTTELEKAPASHPVKLVLASLLSQGKEAFLLKGGLKEFSQCYQDLLAVKTNDGVTNAIDRINCLAKYQQDVAVNQPNPSCPSNVRATEVIPNVFLGNAIDANDECLLEKNNIRYILNVTTNCPNHFAHKTNYHYKQIHIEDSCREDIKEIITGAIDFIELAKANNSSVLIHCQGGVSRSPTITIAYLMHINKLPLTEAYDYVKRLRPCISPNFNFMGQLLDLEQKRTGVVGNIATRNELIKKFSKCSSATPQ